MSAWNSQDVDRIVGALESIAASLEKVQPPPEPIYFVAEGRVNLDDFPPGANIVRCTDPRMAVLNGTNDAHLASIADSLAKLANPPVEVKADTNPRTRDGRTKIKELLGRSDGIVAFKCLDCAKETQIPLVNFVEEPSRWVPVECAHCHRKYELEGKSLS